MSSVVLSAVQLMSSTVNDEGDRNIVITEAPVQINDIYCNDDNDDTKMTHTKSISTTLENKKDLDCRKESPTKNASDGNNISIVTSDESENDSSVIYSDSDIDDVINYNNDNDTEFGSPTGIVLVNSVDPSVACHLSTLCTKNDVKPNIGSIALQNSSDITFGNKTFYQAPVTINNFIYDKNKCKETENDDVEYENSSTNIPGQKEKGKSPKFVYSILKKWKCTKKKILVSATSVGFLACMLLVVILLVIFIPGDQGSSDSGDPMPTGPLKYVSRNDWNARSPKDELTKLKRPPIRVIIAHTNSENCTTQEQCSGQVRAIQNFHMDVTGWDDIGYNFLVGGDGAVYVGRGWDILGAHTKGYNANSTCIAFIGNFQKINPPKCQLYAAQKLIEEGVQLKKLIPDFKLYGQRQLKKTESPGLFLYEIIKKWDHWTEEIK